MFAYHKLCPALLLSHQIERPQPPTSTRQKKKLGEKPISLINFDLILCAVLCLWTLYTLPLPHLSAVRN